MMHIVEPPYQFAQVGDQVSVKVWTAPRYVGRSVFRIAAWGTDTPHEQTILGWSEKQSVEYTWDTSTYDARSYRLSIEFVYPLRVFRPSRTEVHLVTLRPKDGSP